MATWDELNKSAGVQTVSNVPSPSQSGGWASINASARVNIGPAQSPNDVVSRQMSIQEREIQNLPEGAPFFRDAQISAPPQSKKPLELLGVKINLPGSKTGQPIIDFVPSRFEARANENANFAQRGVAAAINTVGTTIIRASEKIGDLFEIGIIDNTISKDQNVQLNKQGFPVAEGSDLPILNPAIRKRLEAGKTASPTTAERVGASMQRVDSHQFLHS